MIALIVALCAVYVVAGLFIARRAYRIAHKDVPHYYLEQELYQTDDVLLALILGAFWPVVVLWLIAVRVITWRNS